MKELQEIVRQLAAGQAGPAVLATLVSVEGSSYRRAGARLLLLSDGTRIGSISGGCLEDDLLMRAERVAQTQTPDAVVYDTTSENDLVWGVGLGCHGIVRVLIEPVRIRASWALQIADAFSRRVAVTLAVAHRGADSRVFGTSVGSEATPSDASTFVQRVTPPTRLVVFGAGNDAQPLVRLARDLGWLVTVADPRPAFATASRFPEAELVIVGPAEDLVTRTSLDSHSVAVVMTHHYVHDVPILRTLLQTPVRYVGLLGPRKRGEKILSDLAAAGSVLPPEARSRVHAPVGLDLGADGPEQVALAIAAEIQAVLGGRDGQPLRERPSPIHE